MRTTRMRRQSTKHGRRATWIVAVVVAASLVLAASSPVQAAPNGVELCRARGNGSFRLIAVDANAEKAMRAQGVGAPREVVPGSSAQVFGDACELLDLPGVGVSVTQARASWDSGWFEAAIFQQLLEELGYDVADPAATQVGPETAYRAMAEGDIDFWADGWYPLHLPFWNEALPDGSVVADHISTTGQLIRSGAAQGFVITKAFADTFGITTIDELNDNVNGSLDAFDAADPIPNNGKADIYGCEGTWPCADIMDAMSAFAGWDNIAQISDSYYAQIFEAIPSVDAGQPRIVYLWTESPQLASLRPGENVVWLGVDNVLDDSNPTGHPFGAFFDQRPGVADFDAAECPMVAVTGICQVGWQTGDIQVTASNDFLAENPGAAALFEHAHLAVLDSADAVARQQLGGEDPAALAAEWIAGNRDVVDDWLWAAITDHNA